MRIFIIIDMINRVLIRIKVLQILYAYYQKGTTDLRTAENELMTSIRKSYDLYHYFLLLIVEVTNMYERLTDYKRNKYRPSEEELHPDLRLLNNRLTKQLRTNEELIKYAKENLLSWANEVDFIKKVMDMILKSDVYVEYVNSKNDSYETDREFWRSIFKHVINNNDEIDGYLQEKDIYWNEDIDIVESFIIKTLKRFDEKKGSRQSLIPMFNNKNDEEYLLQLFRQTILHQHEYRERIHNRASNWEAERVALLDMIIMQIAITEALHFPTIPISVTLNEYIDAAKYYSTPKSGYFINGILEAVFEDMRNERLLFKN
jgi:N utilization substance protein B